MDLGHRVRTAVREDGVERASDEGLHHAIDDCVPQVFLALEVVVEVPLSDPALSQDVIEGGTVVAAEVDEAGRGVEDLIAGRRTLRTLGCCSGGRHVCLHLTMYQPV